MFNPQLQQAGQQGPPQTAQQAGQQARQQVFQQTGRQPAQQQMPQAAPQPPQQGTQQPQQQSPQEGQVIPQMSPQDVDAFYKNIHDNVMNTLGSLSDKQQVANTQPQPAIQTDPEKVKWMKQYQKLNPGTSSDEASKTYDYYVAPKDKATPINQQLKAIDAYYQASKPEMVKAAQGQDPDNSDYGYDHSDKISALGALMTTGRVGIEDTLARFVQLSEDIGEKIKLSPPGSEKMFTDWYNKRLAKDKLYQDAVNAHPVISSIGEFGGQILPQILAPAGEIAKGAEVAGKGIAALAEKAAPEAATALKNAVEPVATRIGASTLWGRVPQLAGTAARGALIGELQYDPSSDNSIRQGLTGAVLNLALHGGGKLVQSLGSKLTPAIDEVAKQFGITLPVHPGMEKLASYIPFTGMKQLLRKRGEQLGMIGQEIGNKIINESEDDNFGAALHGEVLREFKNNDSKVAELSNKLNDIAKKRRLKVNLETLNGVSNQELMEEQAFQPQARNADVLDLTSRYSQLPKYMDYPSANALRQRIGELVGQYENGYKNGNVSSKLKYVANRLYGALNIDLDNYANRVGGEMQKVTALRNDIYINKVLPFKRGKYGVYLDKNYNTDKFIGGFLNKDQQINASTLIDLLPPGSERGMIAARAAIMHHALKAATIEGVGINPEKFIKGALKLGKVNKILYTPEQLNTLTGYQKLINLTKRLSPATFNPESIFSSALGKIFHGSEFYAALYHPHIVLPILGAGNVMAQIMNSEAGRKTLLKIAKLSDRAANKEFLPLLKKTLNIAALNVGSSLSQE